MRKAFVITISILLYLIIIAAVCYGLYYLTGLNQVFNLEIGFLNWIGIILIIRLVLDQKLKKND